MFQHVILGLSVAAGLFFFPHSQAFAQRNGAQPGLVTRSGAILCSAKENLHEAMLAIMSRDDRWLANLGCESAAGGARIVMIERTRDRIHWKVRVPDGKTVWGAFTEFLTEDGAEVDSNGRPRAPRPTSSPR